MECLECHKAFDFPAYADANGLFLPACPFCKKPLYSLRADEHRESIPPERTKKTVVRNRFGRRLG